MNEADHERNTDVCQKELLIISRQDNNLRVKKEPRCYG